MTRAIVIIASVVLAFASVDASVLNAASMEAFDNATVQPGGPRSGTSGKAFYNVEGSSNGTFASFGVMDFNFSSLSLGPVTGVENVVLELTEENAGFSTSGPLSFYYTAATGVNIQPGSSIAYQSGNNGASSVDPAFGTLQFLGSGSYTVTGNGTVETFPLSFSGAAEAAFVDAINNGTALRLIATPDAAGTAATYAGYTNFNSDGPTLTFDTVTIPEPSTVALFALGLVGMMSLARRRR